SPRRGSGKAGPGDGPPAPGSGLRRDPATGQADRQHPAGRHRRRNRSDAAGLPRGFGGGGRARLPGIREDHEGEDAVRPRRPRPPNGGREGPLLPGSHLRCRRIDPVPDLSAVEWVETGKAPHLAEALSKAVAQGAKIVVCDAASERDIEALAEAWAALEIPLLPVDPGPFTAAYATAKASMKKRLLLIAGTPAPTTREQLEVVQSAFSPGVIDVDLNRLVQEDDFRRAVDEIGARMDRLLRDHF